MTTILDKIKERPLIFDGAMGTMIYQKGVFINTCYDELCLSRPELIQEIHTEYVEAGADIIETNSYGANSVKLSEFGLGEKVVEINTRAVEIARTSASDGQLVAGAVGPCSQSHQPFEDSLENTYKIAFAEQCEALAKAGADLILLETFHSIKELELAASAAKDQRLPVSASFTVNEEGFTEDNLSIEAMTRSLVLNPNVDIIGINCGTGPAGAYSALERMVHLSSKPIVVMPNAGYPREVGGRTLYLTSPDYFSKYAKRYIQLGARGIGGCCGTTPAHIQKAAEGIKNLSEYRRFADIKVVTAQKGREKPIDIIPMVKKSPFAAKLVMGQMVTSVEVLPPKSIDMTKLIAKVKRCRQAGSDAVNIPDGPRASARINNTVAAVALQRETGIEAIPHFCCRDRNLMAMQGDLMGGFASGINNFLCVTGDPPKIGDYPHMTGVFDVDAIGLVQMVKNLNHGYDLGGNPIDLPTGILIGVAANPSAVDLKRELNRFCKKVDAGAEYAITQPVFDADALIRFVEEVDKCGKRIPIVAGVWPLASFRNAQFMATEVPGVSVPDILLKRMEKCTSKEDARKMGIDLARETCEKIRPYVQGYQVSAPMGNVETALKVLGLA